MDIFFKSGLALAGLMLLLVGFLSGKNSLSGLGILCFMGFLAYPAIAGHFSKNNDSYRLAGATAVFLARKWTPRAWNAMVSGVHSFARNTAPVIIKMLATWTKKVFKVTVSSLSFVWENTPNNGRLLAIGAVFLLFGGSIAGKSGIFLEALGIILLYSVLFRFVENNWLRMALSGPMVSFLGYRGGQFLEEEWRVALVVLGIVIFCLGIWGLVEKHINPESAEAKKAKADKKKAEAEEKRKEKEAQHAARMAEIDLSRVEAEAKASDTRLAREEVLTKLKIAIISAESNAEQERFERVEKMVRSGTMTVETAQIILRNKKPQQNQKKN